MQNCSVFLMVLIVSEFFLHPWKCLLIYSTAFMLVCKSLYFTVFISPSLGQYFLSCFHIQSKQNPCTPLDAMVPYKLLISPVVQVQLVRWEGQIRGAKGRKALVGDGRSTPLLHCVPLWIFFTSINEKFHKKTPEYMADWQKHSVPRAPITAVTTQFWK